MIWLRVETGSQRRVDVGQRYRYDPKTGSSDCEEPSPAQFAWLLQAGPDDRLPTLNRLQVMRACHDRGWVRSVPSRPEYMLGYYAAEWYITARGRTEVQHSEERERLARELGVQNHRRLSRLM